MTYSLEYPTEACTVCGYPANIHRSEFKIGEIVDCARCGDFEIAYSTAIAFKLPFKNPKERALASHVIRKMQVPRKRSRLTEEFFEALHLQALPTPIEASDNLIVWLAERAEGRPGNETEIVYSDHTLLAILGVVGAEDLRWVVENLKAQQFLLGKPVSELDRQSGTAMDTHKGVNSQRPVGCDLKN